MSKKGKIEDMFYDIKVTNVDKKSVSPKFGGLSPKKVQVQEGM